MSVAERGAANTTGWLRRLPFATAVAVTVAMAVVLARSASFMDLDVYVRAARAVLTGDSLYPPATDVFPFTYPPFAALVLLPLGLAPAAAPWLMSAASIVALARTCFLFAGTAVSVLPHLSRRARAAAIFTVLMCLEPTVETLRLGQVSLLLLWLVSEDLLGRQRFFTGVFTGLATAIKIVPGVFLLFLAGVGRTRAAVVGAATAVGATVLAALWSPSNSATFWFDELVRTTRVGEVQLVSNQSLFGAWIRFTGADVSGTWWWRLIMVLVLVGLLAVAVWIWRSGDVLLGFGVAGLAQLFASPVSWSHHWVLLFPLLVGLANRWSVVAVRVPLVIAVVVLASRLLWRAPHGGGAEFDLAWWWWPVANCYLLVGVLLLWAAVAAVRATQESDQGSGSATAGGPA